MILFFDTYITDNPLVKSFVQPNDRIRAGNHAYRMPSKFEITRYTLDSYANYPWSKVIIRYGFSPAYSPKVVKLFHAYLTKTFPGATIYAGRNPTLMQSDFEPILSSIKEVDDDFVFYSPNNDHPMVTNSFYSLYQALVIAKKYQQKYEFVSIVYSHFSEFIRAGFADSNFHKLYASDAKLIEDTELASVYLRKNGDNSSVQIVNKNLFNYWFSSHDLGDAPLMRAESLRQYFITHNQLMIVPKATVCAHFDGYSHTIGGSAEIQSSLIPPLFIPPGYFKKDIKIAFGYDDYRPGWVNINPLAKKYVFDDFQKGTDLKMLLSDVPMHWYGKVSKVDVNPKVDWTSLKSRRDEECAALHNPWEKKTLVSRVVAIKHLLEDKYLNRRRVELEKSRNLEQIIGKEQLAIRGMIATKKMLKLHVGCGPRVLKGWINVDLYYEPYAKYLKYYTNKFYAKKIRGDRSDFYAINLVSQPLPLKDSSVEIIFHEDFIEHLDQKEQFLFLSEGFRILTKGGIHRINTPEINSSMKINSAFSLGYSGVYQEEWDHHVHKNILSISTLTEMAKLIGYSKIVVQTRDHSGGSIPREYRPNPKDRPENGNLYIDLIK